MYNDRNIQAPYVGRSDDYYDSLDEDDRDVDFEYESWRDMEDERKYSQED